MSDGKLFGRSKSAELKAELEQAFKKTKPHNKIKIVLKKAISNIILNNNEIVRIFPDVVDLMKIDDLEIRKMCFQYVTAYSHIIPKEAIHALPFLNRFRADSSPILRSLAIKTLSSVSNPEFVDLTFKSVGKLLKDQDPNVRKSAAFSVSRLYQNDPDRTLREGLIDELNELLYDNNHGVVSNALASLSYITENGKSLTLTIDKNHALTLISYLSKSNEWCQIYILNSLVSYVPQSKEEALDLIEATMASLQHENSAVVLNAVKVIVYFSNYVQKPELIIPSLPKRLGFSLVSLLSKPPEIQFLVLRNVILLLLGKRDLVHFEIQMFFCKYDDPLYVKDTKLEIIYLLANESNIHAVLRELEEYATEVDVSMARKAIRAFGNIAVKLSSVSKECVEIVCDLLSNGIPYIVQEATIVIKNILRKYPGDFDFAVYELVKQRSLIDEPDSKVAMIWILGQYCEIIENSEIIIPEFISNFKDEPDEVKYATLTTVTKFYLKSPIKGEPSMIKILTWATEEANNPDIRDRGFFYWRLLSSEDANGANGNFQENNKQIILNANPSIIASNDSVDRFILEELEMNIGTLGSIYLKPIQSVFRMAKPRRLPESPALQHHSLPTPPPSESSSSDNPAAVRSFHNNNHFNGATSSNSPSSDDYLENFNSNNSSNEILRNRPLSRHLQTQGQKFSDSSLTSTESKGKLSIARRLSRKASIVSRKNNKKLEQ